MSVYTKNKWFSFVEVIISVSIITIIWVVAATTHTSYEEKTKNTKVTSDIKTLENSLTLYLEEELDLPTPGGNNSFYKEDTSYAHDKDDNAYWVSWYITSNIIPKKYLNYLPLDPRTDQFYWYARTLNGVLWFEIAWVNLNNGDYESIVIWNYSWEVGPYSLVREYNWPDFVYDKSRENFPYNPELRQLVWKVSDYEWELVITTTENYSIDTPDEILEYTLWEWDKLYVWTGSTADLYFSDGSKSILGSTTEPTELTLANLEYREDYNLFTDIKLALSIGSIWTQASKLDEKSEFEVYTTDSVAAVRWTIFWVNKTDESGTNLVVQRWKVQIEEVPEEVVEIEEIIEKIENDEEVEKTDLGDEIVDQLWEEDISVNEEGETFIEVWAFEEAKWLINKMENWDLLIETNTWALDKISDEIKESVIEWVWSITNADQISDFSMDTTWLDISLNIWFNKKFKKKNTLFIIDNWQIKYFIKNDDDLWKNLDSITITWSTMFSKTETSDWKFDFNNESKLSFNFIIDDKKEIEISFCAIKKDKNLNCTKKRKINLWINYL